MLSVLILFNLVTLAGVAQLVGVPSYKLRVLGSIPGQGTYLGCGLSPQLGHVQEVTN